MLHRGAIYSDGVDISDWDRLWIAGSQCYKSLSPDTQFDTDFDTIAAWDDQSADVIRLTNLSGPLGRTPWSAFGAPDDAELGVRVRTNDNFNSHATAMAGIDRAAWTFAMRVYFAATGSSFARFIGINSTTWGSWYLYYDYLSNLLEIRSHGTDSGNIVFTTTIDPIEPLTIISRYDGVTHFGEIRDANGDLIEALSTTHSGVVRTNDFLIICDGQTRFMTLKKMIFYNRFLENGAEIDALRENLLTEDVP